VAHDHLIEQSLHLILKLLTILELCWRYRFFRVDVWRLLRCLKYVLDRIFVDVLEDLDEQVLAFDDAVRVCVKNRVQSHQNLVLHAYLIQVTDIGGLVLLTGGRVIY
jgi:hypothetical protein